MNNTVRQIMTDIVNEAGKNLCKVLGTVAGTNTITAVMSPTLDAYSAGMIVVFTPANTNTGAVTINIDALGALDVFKLNGGALTGGELAVGIPALMVLDSGADDFILINSQAASALQQNSQSGNYTCVAADAGGQILHPSGAGSGDTTTIPANASVAYPVGTTITFVNLDSNSLSIAITTDTMTLAGTTTTGTRTLAQNGIATAVKVGSAAWLISGVGVG